MDQQFKDGTHLAQQLKLGNSKAYDFLMDSLYQKLCTYAYSLTKDHGNAEDIVQNVFVEVWINRMNINPDHSIFNYFYRSVYNCFIDQYRKNKPVIYLEKKYLEAIDLVVQDEHENLDELIKLVHLEIDKLPSKCKEIFLLNKRDGLTHTEISEYLNISSKTVEGHMTRAFKKLGEKLGDKVQPIFFILFDFRNQVITGI
ncbi:sigma-70 family RNA polymerase sigma factor [Arenibacter sp. H213]|uniref:RNA polymerase sigma factor n=1 Tax=Arenibacter sp. H213 TaxID=2183743 RepID=UPI002043F993|nr:sigma-70 family RNA polymerase sigma factor [Arenibacter sp. H213]